MKELEVVQVRKRKTAEQPMEQPVKKPDAGRRESILVCNRIFDRTDGMLRGFRADIVCIS